MFEIDVGQDAMNVMVPPFFQKKDVIISKLHLRGLQEQRTVSKVSIYGIQALFQCYHPTLWTFMKGLEKDIQMQLTPF